MNETFSSLSSAEPSATALTFDFSSLSRRAEATSSSSASTESTATTSSTSSSETASATTEPETTSTPSPSDKLKSDSVRTGAIAGAVVGGIAGLAIVAGLIWFFWRRHKRQTRGQPFLSPIDGHKKTNGRAELSPHDSNMVQGRKQADNYSPQELTAEYNSPQELNAEGNGRQELNGDQSLRRELPA